MKKEKKVWAITLIAFWWCAPNQTNAQQDSVKLYNLSEVVITATKFPKSKSETGKVLTVIDEDQLAQSAGKNISQLLNEQVGLIINGANSNPGKDKSVYLRGAKNEYTLILLDGIPVTDPSGISGGAFDLRLLPIDQVERIEILKGSQSTLFGTDAIAGVINIITKKGGDKPVGAFATLSYGSYNTFKGSVGINGSTKLLDYNIGYTRNQTEGISEAKDESGAGNFDKDGFSQNSFQANLGFKPSVALSIKPFIRYSDFDGKYDAGAFTDDILNTYNGTLLNLGASAQYTLPKGAINLMYANDKSDRIFDGTYGKSEYKGRFNQAELFFNYELAKVLQLLMGISRQSLQMLDQSSVEVDPAVTITSPYLSLFVHNIRGLALEMGGRYNSHSKYGDNFTYSFNPSYLIQNQLKLFFNLSTGFKAPSLYQLYGQFGANPDLRPEKSNSLEGGVQWFSLDKKFDIRAVAFKRKISDVIIYQYPTYSNFDQQNDTGVEIEPSLKVNNKINIRGFYAFVTGEVTNRSGKENNLFRRPKNCFGINASYQASPKLFVSANLKSFGQREDSYFNLTTFTTDSVTLEAYTLLDLYGEYKFSEHFKIFLDTKNILNQKYSEVTGYNTLGFNLNTGVSLKF
ncbi:MAG: TonB-dependent receptor [Bacteroidia bacterium]|nr:TonB-dependent receptor [Bacteroidia bacterium]